MIYIATVPEIGRAYRTTEEEVQVASKDLIDEAINREVGND